VEAEAVDVDDATVYVDAAEVHAVVDERDPHSVFWAWLQGNQGATEAVHGVYPNMLLLCRVVANVLDRLFVGVRVGEKASRAVGKFDLYRVWVHLICAQGFLESPESLLQFVFGFPALELSRRNGVSFC